MNPNHPYALPKILVVYDNELMLKVNVMMLEDIKAEIFTANSGTEAIRISSENDLDLILIDVSMPGIDSFETVKKIRLNLKYANVPIVFITSVEVSEMKAPEGLDTGAIDYIRKPVSKDILSRKIKNYLDFHISRKELETQRLELDKKIKNNEIEYKKTKSKIKNLSSIVEKSLNEIYIFDTSSLRFLFLNNAALKNIGYTFEEMSQMTPLDIKPQYTMESFLKTVKPLLCGEQELLNFQTIHRRKNGTDYPVDVYLQLMDYEGNKVFTAIILDITAKKNLEKENLKIAYELSERVKELKCIYTISEITETSNINDPDTLKRILEILASGWQYPKETCVRITLDNRYYSTANFRETQWKLKADITVYKETTGAIEVFYLKDFGKDPFLAEEVTLINTIANHISRSLERKKEIEENEKILLYQKSINTLQQSLLSPTSFNEKLKAITDEVVKIFDADFCRIWIIKHGDLCKTSCIHANEISGPHACLQRDKCLHLMSSSGRYTHTNGKAHRRVPFGCYKIGLIASGDEHKFLINDVQTNERVHNREWAKELGLKSFAGYQLKVPSGKLLGVMALFAKHTISQAEDAMLDNLASATSFVIQQSEKESDLEQSESRLKEAQATAKIGNWQLNFDNNNLFWSDEIFRIFEIDKNSFSESYEAFLNLVHPEDRELVNEAYTKSLQTKEPYCITHRLIMPDGRIKYVEEQCSTSFSEEGEPLISVGTVQDITERKVIEDQKKESENKYYVLFESNRDGLVVVDMNGRILDANSAYCLMLGYTLEELRGLKSFYDITPKKWHNSEKNEFWTNKLLVNGYSGIYEKEYIHKSGRVFPIELNSFIVKDKQGKFKYSWASVRDISARKEANEQIKMLSSAIEQSTEGVCIVGLDGKLIFVNQACCRMHKYESPKDIIGCSLTTFHPHEQVQKEYKDFIDKTISYGFYVGESIHVTSEGKELPTLISANILKDDSGMPYAIVKIIKDITDRKKIEETLKNSEAHVRLLLNSTAEAIYGIDLNGNCTFANKSCLKMLGYSDMGLLLGKNMHNLIHHSYEDGSRMNIKDCKIYKAFKKGRYINVSDEVLWKIDGSSFPVEYWSYPQKTDKRLSGAVVTFINISERKKAEDKIRNQNEVLIAISKINQLMVTEKNSTRLFSEVCKILLEKRNYALVWIGLTKEGHKRVIPIASSGKDSDYLNEITITWDESVTGNGPTGTAIKTGKTQLCNNITTDPKFVPWRDAAIKRGYASSCVVPMRHDGHNYGVISVYGNKINYFSEDELSLLSELANNIAFTIFSIEAEKEIKKHRDHLEILVKERTAELEISRDKAHEATRVKSEFLANMSHEIRTPMNAVTGLTYLLSQTELSHKQRSFLQKIDNSAKNLLGIINDILDFSKIEAKKLTLENIEFNMEDVLNNLSSIALAKAETKENLEIIFDISPDIPKRLIGDPLRLGQILMNLTGNAIKFTETGSVIVSMDTFMEINGRNYLKVSIKDTGIGMHESYKKSLFQSFNQHDTSITRKYGGTGLGLAISKQLIELMDGDIYVESQEGRGSEFCFRIAIKPVGEEKIGDKSHANTGLRDLKILVVDDNAVIIRIITRELKSFSFEVESALSGDEAIELLEKEQSEKPFDLLLIDYLKTGMSGIETIKNIKRSNQIAVKPKIIMMTTSTKEEVMKSIYDLELDGCLIKPVTASALFDSIVECFKGHKTLLSKLPDNKNFSTNDFKKIEGAHVLLVEDNEVNQEVATEILKQMSLNVSIASNGFEALEKIHKENFDIVLMDIQMPELDGLETTFRIRKSKTKEELPIVAMTAHAMIGDVEKSLQAGMNDHITKPIDPDLLFRTLLKWIKPKEDAIILNRISTVDKMENHDGQFNFEKLSCLDIDTAISRIGGKKDLFAKILKKFFTENINILALLKKALSLSDTDAIRKISHTIKGSAGNIGAEKLHETSARLEDCLKSDDKKDFEKYYDEFESELRQTIDSLCEFVSDSELAIEENSLPYGNISELKELLAQINSFASKNRPKQCKELTAKILASKWPDKVFKNLCEIKESVDLYNFQKTKNLIHSLLKELG